MSVAWNLRLPYLYSSAAPGREWQDYLISPLLERERLVARFRKKSAWFAYLLKEPPRGPPSPVIRPKQHGKIAASTSTSKQYRSIRAYNNHKKVPQQPQPETSFCPTNQPRNMSFSNAYLIFDMHYAYYKVNTYTYIKSTHRALLGQYMEYLWTLSSATRESLRPQFYLLGMGCDVPAAAAAAALLNPQEEEGRQQANPGGKVGGGISQIRRRPKCHSTRKVRATTTAHKQP